MRVLFGAATIAVCATSVSAQELPDLVGAVSSLDGVEVQSSGYFAPKLGGGDLMFRADGGGLFSARLALGRDDLSKVDKCLGQRRSLVSPPPDACQVSIKAEIEIRGSSVDLMIYEVRFLKQ